MKNVISTIICCTHRHEEREEREVICNMCDEKCYTGIDTYENASTPTEDLNPVIVKVICKQCLAGLTQQGIIDLIESFEEGEQPATKEEFIKSVEDMLNIKKHE